MIKALEFYFDEHGTPCARGADERLATYLQTDLQGSVEITKALIARLKEPEFTGDFVGNGHCVDFRENSVLIEALHDPDAPDRMLSRDAMLAQVERWLNFIVTSA